MVYGVWHTTCGTTVNFSSGRPAGPGRVLLRPSWSQSVEPPNQLNEVGGWECWGAKIWDSFQHLWRRELWTWEGTDPEWGGISFEGWALRRWLSIGLTPGPQGLAESCLHLHVGYGGATHTQIPVQKKIRALTMVGQLQAGYSEGERLLRSL